MNICPVGAELFHADGQTDGWTERQTDMMKTVGSFRYFAKVPKINCITGPSAYM